MIGSETTSSPYEYLFGPVPSRRFGRSLGIDLVPVKTCTFDCLFCEVGRTTCHTLRRAEYVPTAAVTGEFSDWVEGGGHADVVTVAGSGEPTLHLHFGDVIDAVHARSAFKTVLLTNSSLLYLKDVRAQAARADIVKVSLSAWDQRSFEKINQPQEDLSFPMLVDGIRAFREEFSGDMRLEVVVLPGINSQRSDMAKIARIAESFSPDSIELNTVVRPPAYPSVSRASSSRLTDLSVLFTPVAGVIAPFEKSEALAGAVGATDLRAMLARRPCTAQDIAGAFSISRHQAEGLISVLLESGDIRPETQDGGIYYVAE